MACSAREGLTHGCGGQQPARIAYQSARTLSAQYDEANTWLSIHGLKETKRVRLTSEG